MSCEKDIEAVFKREVECIQELGATEERLLSLVRFIYKIGFLDGEMAENIRSGR